MSCLIYYVSPKWKYVILNLVLFGLLTLPLTLRKKNYLNTNTKSTFTQRFGREGMSKQCSPRLDAAECGIWSGPTLFATHQVVLDTSIGWR